MKALVKLKPEVGIWMSDVPHPTLGPNDVLIKIKKTAICGTDIHIYNWDEWAKEVVPTPLTVGHEFVGEVVEIGSEVKGVKIGNRVSGEGHLSCGYCRNCRGGRLHMCRHNVSIGYMTTGCFAEYLAMPATNVYPIPDSISDSQAAILDPFGNATHTALAYPMVGEDVLITGAGPVGIMAVAVARHAGARHIVITDINEYRLNLAKKMGASLTIDARKNTLKEAMDSLGMREGFDIALEMSGSPNAFNDMLNHMNHAGKIAQLGFLPRDMQVDWNQFIMKGLQIKGIYGREMFETWYKMIAMLESGLNIDPVITHEFHIDDFQKAFDTMLSGQSGKVVMSWE